MTRFPLIVLFAVATGVCGLELPEFLRVCSRNDPNLDACITDSVNHLKPYLLKGVPEYHLPTLEPLLLKELLVTQSTGIRINATNIKAYGASNFYVRRVKVNLPTLHFEVDIDLPHLYIDGAYQIDGRVLLLPISGSGPVTGNFTDCTGDVVFQGEMVKGADGMDHLNFKEFSLKIKVGHGNLNLENLFGGERVLGDVVNNAINSNFDAFVNEILPLLEKALAEAFLEIGNNIVRPFTYDQLFPEK